MASTLLVQDHGDGTVSFWSVSARAWKRMRARNVPVRDLAAMDDEEQRRIALIAAGRRIGVPVAKVRR